MNDLDIKSRMLDEAIVLFATKGYAATSVRELVAATGVTKPTLYYHFGSKEGVFLAAAERLMDFVDLHVDEALSADAPLVDRIRDLYRRFLEASRANPHAVRFLMTAEHRPEGDRQPEIDLMVRHARTAGRLASAVEAAKATGEVRDDVDGTAAALVFLGTMDLCIGAVLKGLPLPDDAIDHLLHLTFHGVAPR